MRQLAVLSLHTSPLTQPGTGDSGGMNVYVRELVGALAQAGVESTVYVRRWDPELADEVEVEPGFRVVHVDAGPPDLGKDELASVVDEWSDGVAADLAERGAAAVHANYWLSGVAGHRLKHALDLPLVSTFHTLARVKATTGDPEPERRISAETEVIACSDVVVASGDTESAQLTELYGADPARIETVAPGVDHAFFSPGDQAGARTALDLPTDRPVLLFVGRIQPLKGLDVAIEAAARVPDALLVAVGGPSGAAGEAELARVKDLVASRDMTDRVRFTQPQPHHLLSTFYRAADVALVPSRSESFGLVALEAAACGLPVVGAAVGGLTTLIDHDVTGVLVEGRDPAPYANEAAALLADPERRRVMGKAAAERARGYTWSVTAARLRRIYGDLTSRRPVDCR